MVFPVQFTYKMPIDGMEIKIISLVGTTLCVEMKMTQKFCFGKSKGKVKFKIFWSTTYCPLWIHSSTTKKKEQENVHSYSFIICGMQSEGMSRKMKKKLVSFAWQYTSRLILVKVNIAQYNVMSLEHPLYFPDLAPAYFH